ncbi:MAG TPA: CHASE3 domain-containing protein [Ramlibacter sp.]|nr:CHASE3 domain-containing protein [Ramlibacter sp.]
MALRRLPQLAINIILAAVAVFALIGINETGYHRSSEAQARITQAAQMRLALNRLLQNMLDAETGSRGFLLTADGRYLEPYNKAVAEVGQTLATLRQAYAELPDELSLVDELTPDVQRKLSEMDLSVRMRQAGNEDAWKFIVMTDVGMERMNAIRSHVGKLIATANRRVEASEAQVRRSLLLARIGIAAVALAGLLAFYLYMRQTQALKEAGEEQQRALQQERDLLERLVLERTASLAELATHLQQVREQERGHLARELHDELGALLTAAKLDVARLKSRLGSLPQEVSQRLQHLTETLNSGIALKRRIIEDLRPSSLANLGLSASLEILGREFSEQSGVEVATDLEPVKLDESSQLTVYRLVQESLTNVAKYAQAKRVDIKVRSDGDNVEVSVRDDGRGFDPAHVRPSTHGLAGMRHRVQAAGGELRVESARGRGAHLRAVLPQAPAAPAEPLAPDLEISRTTPDA